LKFINEGEKIKFKKERCEKKGYQEKYKIANKNEQRINRPIGCY